ncbi:MAG: glycine zipper domain-containing protein [Candidatus Omnitrophota bacterium]|jgi:uncharacterized protein YcfJ
MNKRTIFFVLLSVVFVFSGCESMGSDTKKGIGIGALAGSVLGGVVGHNTGGHGVEGALIGGAVGAGAGALIGSGMDDDAKKKAQTTQATSAASTQLTILKVVDMVKQGTPDDVIIDEIQKTGSAFAMDAQTVQYLKDNKVSDKVIGYMMTTKK